MRKIFIDLSSDNYLQQPKMFGGYEGEHNETYLQVKLPKRMIDIECSGYRFDFQTSEGNKISSPLIPVSELKDDILSFHLIEQLTVAGKLIFTVVAVRAGQNTVDLISKTNTVILCIENSPKGKVQLIDPNGYKDELLKMVDERIFETSPPVIIDQNFDPESENAQSGKAIAEALATKVDNLYTYEIINGSVTITGAVKDCSKYVIPDTIEGYPVTTIGASAFARKESLVTEVVIPDGVTRIEIGAFTECANLTTLTLPSSVTFIGEDAFGSSNFNNVYYGGSEEQWNAIEVEDKNDGLLNASNIYYNQHYITKAYVEEAISSSALKKQDTLVSGTNIKTFNGESILGSGDITIEGDSGSNGNKVVVLDTKIRTYNTQGWKNQGTFGVTDYWGGVNNINEINVGDIGILRGRNTDTGSDVLLINEVTSLLKEDDAGNIVNRVYTQVVACIQGGLQGATGERGPQGPQGPSRSVSYHKFRDVEVRFRLEKGHLYSFTVKDNGTTKVSIIDSVGNTVVGIANNALSGMTNGMIICSDRCSITGLTGDLSITNLNAYISDRWDWKSTYYLVASDTTGVDIWDS